MFWQVFRQELHQEQNGRTHKKQGRGCETEKNCKHKWKNDLKTLKKQNYLFYSITKKSGSHCEIEKIKDKYSRNHYDSISDSSR